jgi:hypothetical protein
MRRLRQGILAAVLAATMLLTGTASPARAGEGAADDVIDLATLAWNVYRAGTMTADQAAQFVRLLLAAFVETENAILNHIDNIEARDVMGDLRAARIALADYDVNRADEDWVQLYVRQTLADYAGNAYEKYHGVGDDKAKDHIGLAANSIYSSLLTVATDAGLTAVSAKAQAEYRQLMTDIVKELEPKCSAVPVHGTHPTQYVHKCTAANGAQSARVTEGGVLSPADQDALRVEAAKDSAWLVARQTLKTLPPPPTLAAVRSGGGGF